MIKALATPGTRGIAELPRKQRALGRARGWLPGAGLLAEGGALGRRPCAGGVRVIEPRLALPLTLLKLLSLARLSFTVKIPGRLEENPNFKTSPTEGSYSWLFEK